MENKINIAELLKDVSEGTKFYSPLFGEVTFVGFFGDDFIRFFDKNGNEHLFDVYGHYVNCVIDSVECLLFPSKDCRTWENFNALWLHKHFEPFKKVLVSFNGYWEPAFYAYKKGVLHYVMYYGGYKDNHVLPYKGNEDRVGKKIEE